MKPALMAIAFVLYGNELRRRRQQSRSRRNSADSAD
jgi:hypothetical protein